MAHKHQIWSSRKSTRQKANRSWRRQARLSLGKMMNSKPRHRKWWYNTTKKQKPSGKNLDNSPVFGTKMSDVLSEAGISVDSARGDSE